MSRTINIQPKPLLEGTVFCSYDLDPKRRKLKPGMWVQFTTTASPYPEKDQDALSRRINKFYAEKSHFLVVWSETSVIDPGACRLINISQEIADYSPNTCAVSFGLNSIPLNRATEIRAFTREDIEAIYDAQRVKEVYERAYKHYSEMEKYISKYPVQTMRSTAQEAAIVAQLQKVHEEVHAKTDGFSDLAPVNSVQELTEAFFKQNKQDLTSPNSKDRCDFSLFD